MASFEQKLRATILALTITDEQKDELNSLLDDVIEDAHDDGRSEGYDDGDDKKTDNGILGDGVGIKGLALLFALFVLLQVELFGVLARLLPASHSKYLPFALFLWGSGNSQLDHQKNVNRDKYGG